MIYSQNAQQVLRDGRHFCDCHSADDAAEIVRALQAVEYVRGLEIQNDTHVKLGQARNRQFSRCREERDSQPDQIAAYLESEAAKTPSARVRARTLRIAAGNVRAGLWQEDEPAPEGERSYYNQEAVSMPQQGRVR